MTNLVLRYSVLELFQGYSVPLILSVTGVVVLLLGLGIRIVGIHMEGHFKPMWALTAGSVLLVLGVTMELVSRGTLNMGNSPPSSDAESDGLVFEERTVRWVQENNRVDSTKQQMEKELEQRIENTVSEYIVTWVAEIMGREVLASDITLFMWEVLEAPTITMENRRGFGNRLVVHGHAIIVVREFKLNSIAIRLQMNRSGVEDATSSSKGIATGERAERGSKLTSGEWPPM